MLDIVKHITIGDKEYPMAYTLNVMEEIQEKYGTIENWGKVMRPEPYEKTEIDKITDVEKSVIVIPEPKIKDIKWTFTQFINEGIDIENEEKGEKRPFVSEKQVGRFISAVGINNVNKELMNITVASTKAAKNAEDEEDIKNE